MLWDKLQHLEKDKNNDFFFQIRHLLFQFEFIAYATRKNFYISGIRFTRVKTLLLSYFLTNYGSRCNLMVEVGESQPSLFAVSS